MSEAADDIVRLSHGSARHFTPIETFPELRREILSAAMDRAKRFLAEDFNGVTTDGTLLYGLFPVKKTGLSLKPVVDAARAFSAVLNDAQRKDLTFDMGAIEWRSWQNMHPNLLRHGVCLDDLDDAGRTAGLNVVRATLSAAGFENARAVMKLNEHVAEISGRVNEYGEWVYFLSFFGEPSETEPWGWQIDGHHLNVNAFMLGDQLVLTPQFSGSEPVVALSGKYAGLRSFDAEEQSGLALMRTLAPEQQQQATIGEKVPRDVLGTAMMDNLVLPYAGIRYDELSHEQRELLLAIVDVYVGRIRPGHAEIRLDEVRAHLAETYFAWIGGWDDVTPFYYRIHSPVILIEFDHLPGLVYTNKEPTRRHIHTVVRTPNGNDYGRDLLAQHYAQHDHAHPSSPHRRGQV